MGRNNMEISLEIAEALMNLGFSTADENRTYSPVLITALSCRERGGSLIDKLQQGRVRE